MDLYKLHSDPQSLLYFSDAKENTPAFFWTKYKYMPKELQARLPAILTSPRYSYFYARDIIKTALPEAEKLISTDTNYSMLYAKNVLKGPFPAGEEVISKDDYNSQMYARDVLKADFYYDGKLIAKYED